MKKALLLLEAGLLLLFAAACGSSDEISVPEQKTEAELIADLSSSDSFWLRVVPSGSESDRESYAITSFETEIWELTETSDYYYGTATAESPYAIYTGSFSLKYDITEDDEVVLTTVYQDYVGTYEITAYPSTELVQEWFQANDSKTYPQDELLETEIIETPDRVDACEVSYLHQYTDGPYCTITQNDFCLWEFRGGVWTWTGPSRPSTTEYTYDPPEISDSELVNAVATILPAEIGTGNLDSAIVEYDDSDPRSAHVTVGEIESANPTIFDTADLSVDLPMYWGDENRWEADGGQLDGTIIFKFAETYSIPSFSKDESIDATLGSEASVDGAGNLVIQNVTIIRNGKAEGMSMIFGKIEYSERAVITAETNSVYQAYNEDAGYYLYFDKDMNPTVFSRITW